LGTLVSLDHRYSWQSQKERLQGTSHVHDHVVAAMAREPPAPKGILSNKKKGGEREIAFLLKESGKVAIAEVKGLAISYVP